MDLKKNSPWIISFVVIIFVSWVFYLAHDISLETENIWSSQDTADCGVVLTGGAGRLREAFELLAQKRIRKLVVAGVNKNSNLEEIFPFLPFYPEINTADIILEKRSETTFGNARFSLSYIQDLKCQNILLITSQVHMRRAYNIFTLIYPDDFLIKKLTVPNSKAEEGILGLGVEIVKSTFYYILSLVD